MIYMQFFPLVLMHMYGNIKMHIIYMATATLKTGLSSAYALFYMEREMLYD